MKVNTKDLKWIREPKNYTITEDKVEIIAEPHTDLFLPLKQLLRIWN